MSHVGMSYVFAMYKMSLGNGYNHTLYLFDVADT